jgi:hypothetical protein
MDYKELNKWCNDQIIENHVLVIPAEFFKELDEQQAKFITSKFSHDVLIKLPQREIIFFEWLKENDEAIWKDLWSDELFEPYMVGIIFLHILIDKNYRGFPICDLLENENYYFTSRHMVDLESKILVESAQTRFLEDEPLTAAQLLALNISMGPIDIWHFAYKNGVDLFRAKKAVHQLVADGVLVHLKDAGHLATFVEM